MLREERRDVAGKHEVIRHGRDLLGSDEARTTSSPCG